MPQSISSTTAPTVHPGGGAPGADLFETLLARIDDIEGQLRAIPTAADEKALRELRRTIEALSKRDPKFEERVTNRVDVVADRMETVAKTVSTTAAALAAKDGEIAQLHRELELGSVRVDAAVADLRRSLDPAALTEIKRTLAALSEQKLPRGLEGRIEDLTTKLGVLSQRIDTVSSTASTTAAGLAGRDGDVIALRRMYETGTARIDAELADVRRAIDPAPVVELREAVKELSDAAFGQKRSNQRRLDEVGATIDTLVGRLDSFATSEAAIVTRVSGSEEGISALRAYVENDGARLSSHLAELKQSVAALAARAATLEDADGEAMRHLDARVSGVGGKIDDLAAQLDSLTAVVGTTSARVGKQDVELVAIERRFQEASSRVDALVEDLTRALQEFPDPDSLELALQARIDELVGQVIELSSHLTQVKATLSEQARDAASGSAEIERLLGAERGKVDDLAGQLDSLATSAAASATRISGSEEEISAIRSYVEDGAQRLSSHIAELKQSVAALAARATAIEDADGEVARVLDERVSGMSGSVDHLVAQLDSLTATVGTMGERIGKRDVELDTRLVEIAGRTDNLVAELSRALTELPDPASTEQVLEARLGEFDRVRIDDRARVEEVADRLEALVASFASMADRGPASEALERRIDELVERIDDAVDDRATTSSEVARLAAILEVERGAVRSRLESLAAAVESSTGTLSADELERRVIGFDGRVAAAERDREALTTRVGQLAGAFDADRASFQTQLEALAAALSWTSPKSSVEDRLQGLDKRMGDLEKRNADVSSKVSQATTLLPTALRSLEARLDEVAPGTRAATATEHVPPPQPAPRGRLERRPHDPDDEPADDAAPDRTPTAVVPFRGTDP